MSPEWLVRFDEIVFGDASNRRKADRNGVVVTFDFWRAMIDSYGKERIKVHTTRENLLVGNVGTVMTNDPWDVSYARVFISKEIHEDCFGILRGPDRSEGWWLYSLRHPRSFEVGQLVYIRESNAGLECPWGVITALAPERGGVMVRPEGHTASFGWGYSELERITSEEIPRTVWSRLLAV